MNEEQLVEKYMSLVETDASINYLKEKVREMLQWDRYRHVCTAQPFMNMYGTISYDYSGDVVLDNSIEIDVNADIESCFDDLMTGSKRATYTSNYGWHYISFLDELGEIWEEFKGGIFSEFIDEHREIITAIYNISDDEYLMDEIDHTLLMDYHVFDSDFFVEFIKTKIKDCLIDN